MNGFFKRSDHVRATILSLVLLLAACAPAHPDRFAAAAAMPQGPQGALIERGHNLLDHTPGLMPANVRARMSCSACHIAAGTQRAGLSLRGTYALYPQWNKRAKRFITLQDRIAECFLYSMNGVPPDYAGSDMIAMTAYIAWLSRGALVGTGFTDQGVPSVTAPAPPSIARGVKIYQARCQACHGATGSGIPSVFPPLWGSTSFNDGAGMHHVETMAAFVKANMPKGSPNTLSAQEAYDVSAFILSHPRPRFVPTARIQFPPHPARFF